jgi:carbon-monoxide dehydrogenase medium subunit
MWTDYFAPKTVDEAVVLLNKHAPNARIIAGGTDLMLELERGVRKPCNLIDISYIHDIAHISVSADSVIQLGAMVTHNDIVASDVCVARATPLALACREVGAPQIRNRATVAGNLITASPANDTITALMALNAEVTLRSVRGARVVPLSAFYTGVRKTVMQPDELMTEISFRALAPHQRGTYIKLGLRRAQAISVVNCAVVIETRSPSDNVISEARITLGAVAPIIVRASAAETSLVGKKLDENTIAQAATLAQQAATPISDIRSSVEYRSDMVSILVKRALTQLHESFNGKPMTWHAPALLKTQTPSAMPANKQNMARVNGQAYAIGEPAREKSVLRWLREDCGLIGTKEGCAEGECGACTVILDGKAVMSCLVPASRAANASITTIEGVAKDEALHPLQQAFIDCAAVQCGYCTPGFIVSGVTLFDEQNNPTDTQIKEAISGNLCRCTGYYKILEAFEQTRRSVAVEK